MVRRDNRKKPVKYKNETTFYKKYPDGSQVWIVRLRGKIDEEEESGQKR